MDNIKLTPTPELESRGIVAEQKSLDSRSIVAEPKIAKYDLDSLLSTPVKPTEPTPIVGEAPKKPAGKTNPKQLEAAKKWNDKQAQIAIRIPPEIKQRITKHATARNEKLVQFLVRAALEQIKRDNAE